MNSFKNTSVVGAVDSDIPGVLDNNYLKKVHVYQI